MESEAKLEWIEMSFHDIGQSIYDSQPMTDDKLQLKRKAVETALQFGDVSLLRELAQSRGGLVDRESRATGWAKLSASAQVAGTEPVDGTQTEERPPHREEEQMQLDVDRAFVFFPEFDDDGQSEAGSKDELRAKLMQLMQTFFRKHPQTCYYQGYHDIAQVILLVFAGDVDAAAPVLEHISMTFLRDYMLPNLDATLDQLELIPLILTLADPYLGELTHGEKPFYALSSILTCLAHHVKSFSDICTVFDYLLASKRAGFVLYLYVAQIISNRTEIKKLPDKDSVHSFLTTVGEEDFKVFDTIASAVQLCQKYPLSDLGPAWDNISEYSVLKSASVNDPGDAIFIDQLNDSSRKTILQEEQRRKEQESKPPITTIAKRSKNLSVLQAFWRPYLRSRRTMAGVSLFIGLFGVAASYYYRDIRDLFVH